MADRASPASSPVAAAWPLVGRDAELERIALARSDGGCRGVVVSAESGVGKSRLAREAQTAAARDGAPRGLGPGDPQRGHRPARRVREPHRGGRALRRRPRAHAPQRRCARSTARPCGPSCRRSRARRLRAQLAAELRERDPLEPDDALRVARLLLDAGMELPSELLVDAARAANLAGDPELGAQLAPAALADGAGLPAALLLARAHTVRKRFADAEAVLAAVEGDVTSDDAGVDYLEQRCHVLFWGLYGTRETWDLLEIAGSWSDDADWQLRLGPLRLAYAAIFEGPAARPSASPACSRTRRSTPRHSS